MSDCKYPVTRLCIKCYFVPKRFFACSFHGLELRSSASDFKIPTFKIPPPPFKIPTRRDAPQACTQRASSRLLSRLVSRPPQAGTTHTSLGPAPSAHYALREAGHAGVVPCHWPAPAGERGPTRPRPCWAVIRQRLEDTVKMAVVAVLVRRPLEQVGNGSLAYDPARPLPSESPSERPLSLPARSPGCSGGGSTGPRRLHCR